MARERSPDRDKAKQMWLESGGTMKLKEYLRRSFCSGQKGSEVENTRRMERLR
ncbi:phage terminase small subunit-related protein [Paenibacillus sp. USDA918EY]|uniref:PBSX phage terminase small subunit-like N-terminal domain-containing protein n=1 Tax=Paenibacillus albilobatus TaxID=2716884 RepID=A0A919XLZ1_9BACL|nr:hypothetical protein J2TS6_58070 [Paenibacillus albilobatus]